MPDQTRAFYFGLGAAAAARGVNPGDNPHSAEAGQCWLAGWHAFGMFKLKGY